jgi:hypothetical protein
MCNQDMYITNINHQPNEQNLVLWGKKQGTLLVLSLFINHSDSFYRIWAQAKL